MTDPDDLWRHAPEPHEPPDLDALSSAEPCVCSTEFTCVAEEHANRCACCGWVSWWRNPECVQSQPPEFVIDDARPGLLRAPRPDDFAGGVS